MLKLYQDSLWYALSPPLWYEISAVGSYCNIPAARFRGMLVSISEGSLSPPVNLDWFTGGDKLPSEIDTNIPRNLAAGILQYDPTALISYHNGGDSAYQSESWYSFNMLETYNTGEIGRAHV